MARGARFGFVVGGGVFSGPEDFTPVEPATVRNGLSGLGGLSRVNPGVIGRTRVVLAATSSTRSPRVVLGSATFGYLGSVRLTRTSELTHPSSSGTFARLAGLCLYPGPADGV